jgi:hypothetical protein
MPVPGRLPKYWLLGQVSPEFKGAIGSNAFLAFRPNDVEAMRVTTSGWVGIGTSTPNGIIQARYGTDQSFRVYGTVDLPNGIMIDALNDANNTDEDIEIRAPLTAFYGTRVAINTATPSYTLQVNGSVAGTSAYVNLSDARHKKNVLPLEKGLAELQKLNPVTFNWDEPKDVGMKGQQTGFIAQEVEKILPSVVVTEENDEKTKGIKYSELIPILTKAVQELKAENDAQAAKLNELSQAFLKYKGTHP